MNRELRIIEATPINAVTNHMIPVVKLWRDKEKFKASKTTAITPVPTFLSTIFVSLPAQKKSYSIESYILEHAVKSPRKFWHRKNHTN